MLNGNFSRYYNTYSIVHLLNPLCKILASLIYILMTIMSSNMVVILALFLIILIVINISNVPMKYYFKPLLSMKVLFLFIIIINLIFGVSFSNSLLMIFKICLIIIYSSLLLYTTTTTDLAKGISSFLRPLDGFNIPVSKISMAIAFSLNFIPILFSQSNKIIKSQISRGFDYRKGSFKQKILGIKSIFIPMFVLAMKRADEVANAMEVKQFSFNNKRSNIRGFKWHFEDAYMLTIHLVVLALVLVKEVVV